MSVFVGVDIAAKTFDLVNRKGGKASKVESFSQSPQGHAKAIKRLHNLKPTLITMEATGIYYFDLAVALVQAGLPVAVINPKSFHHFAKLKLAGSKTDGVDAALLAEYGERIEPSLWTPPDEVRLALRKDDDGFEYNRVRKFEVLGIDEPEKDPFAPDAEPESTASQPQQKDDNKDRPCNS